LDLAVSGDARDIHSFDIRLMVNATAAQTPWFRARDLQITAKLTAPAGAPTNFDLSWSYWTNLQPYQMEWSARGTQLQLEKLNADSVMCSGFWCVPELVVTNLSVDWAADGLMPV